jgi:hypothetical protein
MTKTSCSRIALFALVLIAAWLAPAAATAQPPSDAVVKVQQAGANYAELTARWWEWALSVPAAKSPLLDVDGSHCSEGQTGTVWFLAGTTGSAPVTRSCTIPAGKFIFLPVANAVNFAPYPEETTLDLRKTIETFMDSATVLRIVIDGAPIKNLRSGFRVQSPVFATFTPPGDIVFNADVKQYWNPVVADGYWVLLAPLAAGPHQIRINGELPGLVVDVTYHLTIR